MGLDHLNEGDYEVVLRCIRAVAEGPFLCDGDFHSMVGLERSEMAAVARRWPAVDESEENGRLAINNSINALLIWFGWQDEDPDAATSILRQWTGVTPNEIDRVFKRWRRVETR